MDCFYKDTTRGINISYKQLVADVNATQVFNPYIFESDYYQIFKQLIVSLLLDTEVCLLDNDFSEAEILQLTNKVNLRDAQQEIKGFAFDSFKAILTTIYQTKNWSLKLFTSGSTGIPKEVSHNFSSLTKTTKIGEKFSSKVWGLAFNPTHMAGVQVFMQALLNANTIINIFDKTPKDILDEIATHKISHISATPTYLRLLVGHRGEVFNSVERVTFGGERYSTSLEKHITAMFPNAQVRNVYASTEVGALFTAIGEEFRIPEKLTEKVKIVDKQLHVHETLLGNVTKTHNLQNGWYNTGDLVEYTDDSSQSFRFVSRDSDMINVGGYKVNPLEVEEVLLQTPNVLEARVFSKKNSLLGNLICAEVVSTGWTEQELRTNLGKQLQEFKVPRIIKFVDAVKKTRTGKTQR